MRANNKPTQSNLTDKHKYGDERGVNENELGNEENEVGVVRCEKGYERSQREVES